MKRVLILGGAGRIGGAIARDLAARCRAIGLACDLTLSQRSPVHANSGDRASNPNQPNSITLDLEDQAALSAAIAAADLVVHAAGPFAYRDDRVLRYCIASKTHYLDVSDHRAFTEAMLALHDEARSAGIVAIINTGVFPGLSNSLVKACVERVEQQTQSGIELDSIALHYAVSGSGGAGVTVMRTTFLALQHAFTAKLNGEWRSVLPYRDRESIAFPSPFGTIGTYWFDVPETLTLARHFNTRSVTTKFGSAPDFYNYLTAAVARFCPAALLQHPTAIEFLSQVSFAMTQVTDRWSGVGVAMRARVVASHHGSANAGDLGDGSGQAVTAEATLCHDDTARAAGVGAGSVAAAVLTGEIAKPGVWTVEQSVSTALFERSIADSGFRID
ncbi:MAG: NAD-dependent epimerase/dehydratase family protein [Oscillatoriales cyanobacterium]|nr:MAG: NAD-dependent epimerase/dehydratase family protein [Oscillatoriales cyanobacterium]